MRAWRRWLVCLCAAALIVGLSVPALADEVTVYHTALNDKLMELSSDTMPAQVNGVLYVPYLVFDRDYTGVDLGVFYGLRHTDTANTLTLYTVSSMLVFDLNAGTCVDGLTGESKNMKAIYRNDKIYVPLGGVCSFFGLKSSYTPTSYGTLVRITNGQEAQDTTTFVYAAASQMKNRYNKYTSSLNPSSSPSQSPGGQTASPSPSPTGQESTPPEQNNVQVYLAFCCETGEGLESILDTLAGSGTQALFLFGAEEIPDSAQMIRRIVASGHSVGLMADSQAQLEQGSALLEKLLYLRVHTVLPGEELDERTLEEAGWACWPLDVDARGAEGSQNTLSSEIVRRVGDRRHTAYVTMDDSSLSAGALSRVLSTLRQEEYSIRLPVETELG